MFKRLTTFQKQLEQSRRPAVRNLMKIGRFVSMLLLAIPAVLLELIYLVIEGPQQLLLVIRYSFPEIADDKQRTGKLLDVYFMKEVRYPKKEKRLKKGQELAVIGMPDDVKAIATSAILNAGHVHNPVYEQMHDRFSFVAIQEFWLELPPGCENAETEIIGLLFKAISTRDGWSAHIDTSRDHTGARIKPWRKTQTAQRAQMEKLISLTA